MNNAVGKHIGKLRRELGLSQEQLAEKLSADMAHLRVDLYEIEGKVYFGELTFYDSSGMAFFDPPEWDETIGSWLNLPEKE